MPSRVIAWIDERFPLTSFAKHELTEYPTPRNLSYWWNIGFLAGVVLVLQHIMRDVNYGWLIRYIHSTGASAFFIVVYIHMARTLYYGSYRAPVEWI